MPPGFSLFSPIKILKISESVFADEQNGKPWESGGGGGGWGWGWGTCEMIK